MEEEEEDERASQDFGRQEAWIGAMLEVIFRVWWNAVCWTMAWLHFEKGAKDKFLGGLHYVKDTFKELRVKVRENFNIEPCSKVMEYVNKLGCSFEWGKWKERWKERLVSWFQRKPAWEKCDQSRLRQGRYGIPRRKTLRWNGTLKKPWMEKKRLRGMLLVSLLTLGQAMDQQQAENILGRVMELSTAATEAARSTASAMEFLKQQAENEGDARSRFSDASKVLKQPDCFEVDDPIKFTMWREQFLNWLCFSDSRYLELVKLAEEALDDVDSVMRRQSYPSGSTASWLRTSRVLQPR